MCLYYRLTAIAQGYLLLLFLQLAHQVDAHRWFELCKKKKKERNHLRRVKQISSSCFLLIGLAAIQAAHLAHAFSVLWSARVCHGGTSEQKQSERTQVAQGFLWCCEGGMDFPFLKLNMYVTKKKKAFEIQSIRVFQIFKKIIDRPKQHFCLILALYN